jgi:hypothetical protein
MKRTRALVIAVLGIAAPLHASRQGRSGVVERSGRHRQRWYRRALFPRILYGPKRTSSMSGPPGSPVGAHSCLLGRLILLNEEGTTR